MKGKLLRLGQDMIVRSPLYRVFVPFTGLLSRIEKITHFAQWKRKNKPSLTGYMDLYVLYTDVIMREQLADVYYLEFGVSKGKSMRWWTSQITDPASRFFGFDTFEGIPEDWGSRTKGSYTNDGKLPDIKDERLTFLKGLFQDTLPGFIHDTYDDLRRHRMVVHLDADLYSATLFCLCSLAPVLKAGDLIIFDQLDMTTHEFRAFYDFQSAYLFSFECIGEADDFKRTVVRMKERK